MSWPAATCLIALALAAPARAQQPAFVLLKDPSGNPVADAAGWLRCEAAFRLDALPTPLPAPVADAAPGPVELRATSDARGVLRFVAPADGRPGAGSGYVTTDAGLGALLPRLHAGRPERVTLQPMAAVTTATGSEEFELFARAELPDGARIDLPPMRGAAVRLPAGTYEVWAKHEDGFVWQRLRLSPGGRAVLSFAGPAQRVAIPRGAFVHPAGRPGLALRAAADDAPLLLRGAALAAPLVAWRDGVVTPPRVVPGPPTTDPKAWTLAPPDETARWTCDDERARVFGLLRRDDGSFRVLAHATVTDGAVELTRPPRGDAWLLVLAPGHAPRAQPWSDRDDARRLVTTRGVDLVVAARDATGLPSTDLFVAYTPAGEHAARVVARTDARGVARFGPVHAPGAVTVEDPRCSNQRLELERVPVEPLELTTAPGATCTATIAFADGADEPSVVVTLRDPRGVLRPAERAQVARPGEPARFGGLPDDRDLVLFATALRDGKTWSARATVRAGGEAVELVLRNEDPVFRPSGGR